MKSNRHFMIIMFFLITLGLAACGPSSANEAMPEEKPVLQSATEEPTVEPSKIPEEPTVEPTAEPEPTVETYPAQVQELEFASTDGTMLKGEYYPPEMGPAPVVVLMHQYPLDHQTQWFAVAPWLQDRGLAEDVVPGNQPWGDPSWFPEVPEDLNVGVLAFTFRGCQGGCQNAALPGGDRSLWAEDARAALRQAASLPGADPTRIIAVGTSIGADGAVDGCLLAVDDGIHCAGAMSWSPGDYLTMSFPETAEQLTKKDIPVHCIAGEGDGQSAAACRGYTGDGYESTIDPSSNHGIALVDPDLETKTLELLLNFIAQVIQ